MTVSPNQIIIIIIIIKIEKIDCRQVENNTLWDFGKMENVVWVKGK